MSVLIEPQDLVKILNDDNVRLIDATYGSESVHTEERIGNAVFFDIDTVAEQNAAYPHTFPSADVFASAVSTMGINNDDMIVVYDKKGLSFAAARVWWMFRAFGHKNIRVLNGGLSGWKAENLPLNTEAPTPPEPTNYKAVLNPDLYRSFDDIEKISHDQSEVILDARAAERFNAPARTVDGDMTTAHIPNSYNQPFAMLLDHEGKMKSDDELIALLKPHIQDNKKMIMSCGSGVTACVLALGYVQSGLADPAVFDGSWTEWSDRQGIK